MYLGEGYHAKILLAEKDSSKRESLRSILSSAGFDVVVVKEEIYNEFKKEKPDVVLIGFELEKETRIEAFEKIREEKEKEGIPVLAILEEGESEEVVLKEGLDDCLAPPFLPQSVVRRVSLYVRMRNLEEEVRNAKKVLLQVAQTIEMKEGYPREHPQRVAKVATDIGQLLELERDDILSLQTGALFHDIGKIGVSENILRKPGKLTPNEFEEVKLHPVIGERLLRPFGILEGGLPAIRHHHERWDGTGYPDGLSGEEIPLIARIVSVADAFVAFTSDRPYRKAFSRGEVLSILVGGAGSYWDPMVIWALLKIIPK